MGEASAHSVKDEEDSDYRKKHVKEKNWRGGEAAKHKSHLKVFVRNTARRII